MTFKSTQFSRVVIATTKSNGIGRIVRIAIGILSNSDLERRRNKPEREISIREKTEARIIIPKIVVKKELPLCSQI